MFIGHLDCQQEWKLIFTGQVFTDALLLKPFKIANSLDWQEDKNFLV